MSDDLDKAFDAFSKAASMPGGPSLAMQHHDPTWGAWKKLCDAFAERRKTITERDESAPFCVTVVIQGLPCSKKTLYYFFEPYGI